MAAVGPRLALKGGMEQTAKFKSTAHYFRSLIHVPLALLTVLFAAGLSLPVHAGSLRISTAPAVSMKREIASTKTSFEFTFRLDAETKAKLPKAESPYKFRTQAASYDEAFKKAAQACYNHFKAGERLSEEAGLGVIDTCANPRGS